MYPLGYICLSEGVHFFYICNKLTLRHQNGVYLSSKMLKVLLIIQYIFGILLSFFVIRNFMGTCSSIEMLMGYMFRERLVTSVL